MWVRTPNDTLAFLLSNEGFKWDKHKFHSLRAKAPDRAAFVRMPSGQIKRFSLLDLRFDSETTQWRQQEKRARQARSGEHGLISSNDPEFETKAADVIGL